MGRRMLTNILGSDDSISRVSFNISVDGSLHRVPHLDQRILPKVLQAVGTPACSCGWQHYHRQCRFTASSAVLCHVASSCAVAHAGASAVETTARSAANVVMDAQGASDQSVIQSFALQ